MAAVTICSGFGAQKVKSDTVSTVYPCLPIYFPWSDRTRCQMPNDLRWSWYNNSRNKVHNKCNVLVSSPNHPRQPWSMRKLSSQKLSLVEKRLLAADLADRACCWLQYNPLWSSSMQFCWWQIPDFKTTSCFCHLFCPSSSQGKGTRVRSPSQEIKVAGANCA